jgi:nicotinamide riboside kinase
MIRIAIVGPERSGKTTLSDELMMHLGGGRISDGTREYVADQEEERHTEQDFLDMARSQAQWFQDAPSLAAEYWEIVHGDDPMIGLSVPIEPTYFDSDILNLKILSQEKFGRVHPEIERLVRELKYDLRLLCRPDFPVEPDPLRVEPLDRERIFDVWERELKAYGFPYVIIEGSHERRVNKALSVVEAMLRGATN